MDPLNPINREELEAELVANPGLRPLIAYVEAQEAALGEDLRHREMPAWPWPSTDNPMLRHLIAQAKADFSAHGLETVLTWLAVHAWFEGGLESRATVEA